MSSIDRVAEWVAGARRGVGFTGAGISTESGIPDFRGPGGFWQRNDASKFTLQNWIRDEEHRKEQWKAAALGRSFRFAGGVEPNAGHVALARLEQIGRLHGVITQNVDGLHQRAGSRKVLELHGTTTRIGCLSCGRQWPSEEVLLRVAEGGEEDPRCTDCGGILKRATISFGQSLPQDVLEEAHVWSMQADLFVVVGSSLVVYPAAALPEAAKSAGARLVIVNREPTPLDSIADAVLHTEAGPALTEILELAAS